MVAELTKFRSRKFLFSKSFTLFFNYKTQFHTHTQNKKKKEIHRINKSHSSNTIKAIVFQINQIKSNLQSNQIKHNLTTKSIKIKHITVSFHHSSKCKSVLQTTQTKGVTTQTKGVTTQTEGVTTQTEGVTTQTKGVTTQTKGVTTQTTGVTTHITNEPIPHQLLIVSQSK